MVLCGSEPPSAESSSIYCVFPVVSVTMSIFWITSTSLTVLSDLVVVRLYVTLICSFLHYRYMTLHYNYLKSENNVMHFYLSSQCVF